MRPKKVILLVNANERELGMQRFVLETRGYRVLTALDAADALILHARGVDLVLGMARMDRAHGPVLDWSAMTRSMKAAHSTPIVMAGPMLNADELCAADGVLSEKRLPVCDLLGQVHLLIQRKRGPRKVAAVLAPAVAGD